MGMRKEFANMTERDIQEKLDQRYPDEHFDVVVKCWKLGYCTTDYYNKHLGQHTYGHTQNHSTNSVRAFSAFMMMFSRSL